MKVLVTGAAGQVGYEVVRCAPGEFDVTGLNSTELDITDEGLVKQIVSTCAPQLIINTAAYTAVDRAESEPDKAYAVNEFGVQNLAMAAKQQRIPILHLSTDYVFDGTANQPYKEHDVTAPASVYGASKLAGEQALARYCPEHIVLRTSWVFGAQGSNFVKTMLRLGGERTRLNIVEDQLGCPTSAASIADALWNIARQYKQKQEPPWGLYHFSNQPVCSWYDFACEIFRQAGEIGLLRVPEVKAITTGDYPTPAARPKCSVMECHKIQDQLGINQKNWNSELALILQEFKKS